MLELTQEQNKDNYFNTIEYVLQWCKESNLDLNISKTKEMIHDFRKRENIKQQITIDGTVVTTCTEYKYLGCFIQENLKLNKHTKEQI